MSIRAILLAPVRTFNLTAYYALRKIDPTLALSFLASAVACRD